MLDKRMDDVTHKVIGTLDIGSTSAANEITTRAYI